MRAGFRWIVVDGNYQLLDVGVFKGVGDSAQQPRHLVFEDYQLVLLQVAVGVLLQPLDNVAPLGLQICGLQLP